MLSPTSSLVAFSAGAIPRYSRGAWLFLSLAMVFSVPLDAGGKAKPNRIPRPEPELKILDFKIAPTPYNASSGALEITLLVQLPKDLDGATLLEVSSLVSSPSKTSIRFLSTRKALEAPVISALSTDLPRLPIVLTWDGMDHKKTQAGAGLYQYELRAKLLANGEKGPRTLMVSWPKRGTIEVK